MRVTVRILVAAAVAVTLAVLVGQPAGTTAKRANLAALADEAETRLASEGVPLVVDGYAAPEPECNGLVTRVMPLIASDTVGAPSPRDAVLVAIAQRDRAGSIEPSMELAEVGRVHGGELREAWALVHAGGAVTTLEVGQAPVGGWMVQSGETCIPRPS